MTVLCIYSMAGVPLTTSNVLAVVRKVKNWWGELGGLSLTDWLFIPESKKEGIKANFPDELDQKKEAISYWINTDPLASWRRLITALDKMEETELANSIRSNAEPLTGVCIIYACIVDMYLIPPREMVELNPLPLIEQHPKLFVSHDFCSAAAPDVWVTLVLQIQTKSTY